MAIRGAGYHSGTGFRFPVKGLGFRVHYLDHVRTPYCRNTLGDKRLAEASLRFSAHTIARSVSGLCVCLSECLSVCLSAWLSVSVYFSLSLSDYMYPCV